MARVTRKAKRHEPTGRRKQDRATKPITTECHEPTSTVTGPATTPTAGLVVAYLPAGHVAEPPTEPQPSGAAATA